MERGTGEGFSDWPEIFNTKKKGLGLIRTLKKLWDPCSQGSAPRVLPSPPEFSTAWKRKKHYLVPWWVGSSVFMWFSLPFRGRHLASTWSFPLSPAFSRAQSATTKGSWSRDISFLPVFQRAALVFFPIELFAVQTLFSHFLLQTFQMLLFVVSFGFGLYLVMLIDHSGITPLSA